MKSLLSCIAAYSSYLVYLSLASSAPNANNAGGHSKYNSVREVQYFYLGIENNNTHSSLEGEGLMEKSVASLKPTSTAQGTLFTGKRNPSLIFKQHD